jgi:hypothetical protein
MRIGAFSFLLALALASPACHLPDDNRCDDGQLFDGTACIAPDTDSDVSADAGADAGFTGMMEPCATQADCAEYEATYCLTQMPDSNVCLIPDCSADPDDCPSPYLCCDLLPELETSFDLPGSLCMPPEYWDAYSAYCVNG